MRMPKQAVSAKQAPVTYSAVIGATYIAGCMFQSLQASTYSLEYLTWAEKSCNQSAQVNVVHSLGHHKHLVLLGTHRKVLHVAFGRRREAS